MFFLVLESFFWWEGSAEQDGGAEILPLPNQMHAFAANYGAEAFNGS